MAAGVPMTFERDAAGRPTLDVDADGQPQPQIIARGPVAAMIAIKHLGTNGGGFFGANSAHPFENPNAWSNFLDVRQHPDLPVRRWWSCSAACSSNMRHAAVIFGVMMVMFVGMIGWAIYWDTLQPNPALTAHAMPTRQPYEVEAHDAGRQAHDSRRCPAVAGLPVDQATRATWKARSCASAPPPAPTFAAVTTAITCGSVNCMHDSLNPLAGLTPLHRHVAQLHLRRQGRRPDQHAGLPDRRRLPRRA